MSEDRQTTAQPVALIATGVMFIVVGMNSSRGLIAAGVVFLFAAIIQQHNSQGPGDGTEE